MLIFAAVTMAARAFFAAGATAMHGGYHMRVAAEPLRCRLLRPLLRAEPMRCAYVYAYLLRHDAVATRLASRQRGHCRGLPRLLLDSATSC